MFPAGSIPFCSKRRHCPESGGLPNRRFSRMNALRRADDGGQKFRKSPSLGGLKAFGGAEAVLEAVDHMGYRRGTNAYANPDREQE